MGLIAYFFILGVHTYIDLMDSCHICQSGIRLKLALRNYQKWSALMLDHLRQHQEVLPCLYSQILPPNFNWKHLSNLLGFLCNGMSKESFLPLLMPNFPHDIWMALWEAYGDP